MSHLASRACCHPEQRRLLRITIVEEAPKSHIPQAIERVYLVAHRGENGQEATASLLKASPWSAVHEVATLLLNELADMPQDVMLVLDDYHFIRNSQVHSLLERLIEGLPPHLPLVLVTRADPPLPLVKWLAQGRLNQLRRADLRFTLPETQAFLAGVLGQEAAHESALALEERTQGWIALVRPAALSLGSISDRAAFLERLAHSPDGVVSSYLLEELLSQLAPAVQKFLERRSLLEPFYAQLCVATFGSDLLGQPYALLALVRGSHLKRLLRRMLDPREFLSNYGIRSLSKYYPDHPYELNTPYGNFTVTYTPAESNTAAFGGNSNWRGPIWFPINFLLIEALQKFHRFYGEELLVECPTDSGTHLTLGQVAQELADRLTHIFLRDERGDRAVFGANAVFQRDPCWRDDIPFYEYFHGETGAGLGASHQTGWTALIANVLEMSKTGVFATGGSGTNKQDMVDSEGLSVLKRRSFHGDNNPYGQPPNA